MHYSLYWRHQMIFSTKPSCKQGFELVADHLFKAYCRDSLCHIR